MEAVTIWVSGKQVRTFGDLRSVAFPYESATCRFCKRIGCNVKLAKYGVRHYVCTDCIDTRADAVLPEVLRTERRRAFWAKHNG